MDVASCAQRTVSRSRGFSVRMRRTSSSLTPSDASSGTNAASTWLNAHLGVGLPLRHADRVAREQDPVAVAGLDELDDEGGAFAVVEVPVVVQADVVDADEGAPAGDLEGNAVRDRVTAIEVADEHTTGRELLVEDDVEVVERVGAVSDRHRDAGVARGARRAAEQALLGRGHAVAGGRGGHEPGRGTALDAGDHHALGDLFREEIGELLGRPRRRRVRLRRQEVAAEHLFRTHSRRGDDVHAGGTRERLVQREVASVEHARAVDDRRAAVLAEVGQLARRASRRPLLGRC